MKNDDGPTRPVLVRELDLDRCFVCDGTVGLGLKEEPTGWKVYRVCIGGKDTCSTERVGMVSRGSVEHFDEVIETATGLVEQR